ncbi:MSS4, partial [Symbiodinium microadriaticum]
MKAILASTWANISHLGVDMGQQEGHLGIDIGQYEGPDMFCWMHLDAFLWGAGSLNSNWSSDDDFNFGGAAGAGGMTPDPWLHTP